MANTTYIPSSNTATNGVALGADAQRDVVVDGIFIGAPVSAGNIWLYSITNPVNGATTNIVLKLTLPTFSTTNINPGVYNFDFDPGLLCNQGGAVIIDQTMQVSVTWHYLDEQEDQS
jgi:hypothetical protein